MISIAPWDITHYLLLALLAWAGMKLIPYIRPIDSFRNWRWTIVDWFDTTFWIGLAQAIIFSR